MSNLKRMDATAFAHEAPDDSIVIIEIPRARIEAGNIATTLEKLLVLSDTAENVRRYKESVVLYVNGYDADPRELWAIPEVKVFFRILTAEWPHWMWFLYRDLGMLRLIVLLLCESRSTSESPSGQSHSGTRINAQEFESITTNLQNKGRTLISAYGIPIEEFNASVVNAMNEISGP